MSENVSNCVHCGYRIVLVNYALGPSWTHQSEGSAFQDNTHSVCHTTVATPPSREDK